MTKEETVKEVATDRASGDRASGDRASGDRASGDRASGDRRSSERVGAERVVAPGAGIGSPALVDHATSAPAERKPAAPKTAASSAAPARPSASDRPQRGGRVPLDDIANGIAGAGARMSTKLRELLVGTVTLRVVDRARAFTFDPVSGGFTLTQLAGPEARTAQGDCVIELSEMSLQRMWNGDLNPQIAMLSDKVAISGKAELAVYFFNLVAAD